VNETLLNCWLASGYIITNNMVETVSRSGLIAALCKTFVKMRIEEHGVNSARVTRAFGRRKGTVAFLPILKLCLWPDPISGVVAQETHSLQCPFMPQAEPS
jgi:hypothetical protein